jgi:hypothetical protein
MCAELSGWTPVWSHKCRHILARVLVVGPVLSAGLAVLSLVAHADNTPESTWTTVQVPAVWKSPPAAIQTEGEGFAWFRARFLAADDWRDCDLALLVEAADDAREYYLNGTRVATSGRFPPRYRSGLGEQEEHPLDSGLLRPGEENQFAVRVFQQQSRTNFNVAAPVILAGNEAIHLKGTWELHVGDLSPEQASRNNQVEPFQERVAASSARGTWKLLDSDEGPLPIDEALGRFQDSRRPGD